MQRCPLCGEERLTESPICGSCGRRIDGSTVSKVASSPLFTLPTQQITRVASDAKTRVMPGSFSEKPKQSQFKRPFALMDVPTSPTQTKLSLSLPPLQAQQESVSPVTPLPLIPPTPVKLSLPVQSLPETPVPLMPASMPIPYLPKKRRLLARKRVKVAIIFSLLLIISITSAFFLFTPRASSTNGRSTGVSLMPATLVLVQSRLDFGPLEQGKKAVLGIPIANKGEKSLSWTVDTGGATWLTVASSSGMITTRMPQATIDTTADTTSLPLGAYNTMLRIDSNGGSGNIAVSMQVVTSGAKKQARLVVTPPILNFQTMSPEQQAQLAVSVSNTGNDTLDWQADIGDTQWAGTDVPSGSIEQQGVPQAITVQVDTTGLAVGSYSAILNISSNGGDAAIDVVLIVAANGSGSTTPTQPTQSPRAFPTAAPPAVSPTLAPVTVSTVTTVPSATPTPSPTVVPTSTPTLTPATMSASPTDFMNGKNCTSSSSGWACVIALTNTSNMTSLNWSATSSATQVSFSPAGGTLAAGKTVNVTINVAVKTICPAQITFNFSYGSTNPISANWSCGAPTLSVSPTSLIPANCTASSGTRGGWQCSVTLSDDVGGANWTASSTIKVSLSPASGTIYAGVPNTISVVIGVCSSGTISFQGPGNTVAVAWTCTS